MPWVPAWPGDDYTDWAFRNWEALEEFGHQGFKWQYVGDSSPELGEHIRIADEYPGGDVLLFKKLVPFRLLKKHNLAPVSLDTIRAAARLHILDYFSKRDGPIEVVNERSEWVAVIHPATRAGAEWQGSMFDKNGPFSHMEGPTKENVLDQLVYDGFTVPEEGAMDRLLDPSAFYDIS